MLRPKNAFKLCGVAGLLLGGPLAIWLALRQGLSPWTEVELIAVAVGMLLLTPLTVKVFTGVDGFVFYRDVICIFAAVWLTLRWLHQPVLPYLDVTIAGAGMFHACGRIGCLLSGCCFGRPSRIGVRYRDAHSEMGFPSQLVGVRLFPIQVAESVWILTLVASATLHILRHARPGSAFAFYVCGYALGRFFFEFARGDADRPYWLGFSQAQWISLFLTLGVNAAEFTRILPRSNWHASAFALLALMMFLVSIVRWLNTNERFELLHPRHIHELARALERMSPSLHSHAVYPRSAGAHPHITVSHTSLGLRLSAGEIARGGSHLLHYCVSREGTPLSPRSAHLLAHQISCLRHDSAAFEVSSGNHGIMHILFPAHKPVR